MHESEPLCILNFSAAIPSGGKVFSVEIYSWLVILDKVVDSQSTNGYRLEGGLAV